MNRISAAGGPSKKGGSDLCGARNRSVAGGPTIRPTNHANQHEGRAQKMISVRTTKCGPSVQNRTFLHESVVPGLFPNAVREGYSRYSRLLDFGPGFGETSRRWGNPKERGLFGPPSLNQRKNSRFFPPVGVLFTARVAAKCDFAQKDRS